MTKKQKLDLDTKIVVIGAGIAGLACSIALAQKGYKVDLYEKRKVEDISQEGFASYPIQIRYNVLDKLNQLGAQLNKDSVFEGVISRRGGKDGKYKQIFIPLVDSTIKWRYMVSKGLYESIMTNYQDKISLNFSDACVGVDFDEKVLRVEHGEVPYDLLLCCDGVNSPLRQMYQEQYPGQLEYETIYDYKIIIVNDLPPVKDNKFIQEKKHMHFILNDKIQSQYFIIWPNQSDDKFSLHARYMVTDGKYNSLEEFFKYIAEKFRDTWPEEWFTNLLNDPKKGSFTNKLMVPNQLVGKDLIFLGDCAHPITNFTGMGTDLAIRDIAFLEDVFINGTELNQVSQSYNNKRLQQVKEAQQLEQLSQKAIFPSSTKPFYFSLLIISRVLIKIKETLTKAFGKNDANKQIDELLQPRHRELMRGVYVAKSLYVVVFVLITSLLYKNLLQS